MFKTVSTLSAIAVLAALAGSPTRAAASDGYDRRLNLVNRSGEAITSFFASNRDDPDWEWDLLGYGVVHPGHYTQLDLDDGSGYCRFDLRTVLADGRDITRYDVNVCAVHTYVIE